ncbi:GNAT family [Seiridium cupressi]
MSTGSPGWAIKRIPAGDAGFEFYLKEYKPFRLNALKQDPQAFGSTYAKEVAFKDEDWGRRLRNPVAKTFVVVRLCDRRILAATTLFGPMPNAELLSNPNLASATAGAHGETDVTPLLYQLTGVYTRAEARGQGLGQAVVKVATECTYEEARGRGRDCKLMVDVYATNTVAIAFYETCGFAIHGPRPVDSDSDDSRPELLMQYRDPHDAHASSSK